MINIEDNEMDNEIVTISKPDNGNAFRYALNSIDIFNWYLFGTLTWSRENRLSENYISQKYREYDFNNFLNVFCANFKLKTKYLEYYRGTEYMGYGQAHFNFVLARNGLEHISADDAAAFMHNLWLKDLKPYDSDKRGIGMCKIKPYDHTKGNKCLNYITKLEFDENNNLYESYPFVSNRLKRLILSENSLKPDYSLN